MSGKHLIVVVLAALLFTLGACEQAEQFKQASAYKISSRSELIGGPKALGNIGDYMLENDKIRVVINGHPTDYSGGGVNKWGGSIIDADIQRVESYFDPATVGRDQLLELMPIFDVKTFGVENIYGSGPVIRMPQDAIEIVSEGSEDEAAAIKVKGVLHELVTLLKLIPVPLNVLPVEAETIYSLAPGDNFVKITTTFRLLNRDGSEPTEQFDVPLRPITADDNPLFAMFTGDAFGDALFYGDSLDIIGPGVFGFSASFYVEDLYKLGKSTFTAAPLVDWSAGVADDIGYALVSADSPLSFPIMEDFLTIAFQRVSGEDYILPKPGSTYTYERYLVVDEGDVAGLLDHIVAIKEWPYANIKGNVLIEGEGAPATGAKVLVFPHPRFSDDGTLVPLQKTFEATNEYLQSFEADAIDYHRLIPYSRFGTDSRRFDLVTDGSFAGKLPIDGDTGESHYILMASGPGNVKSELLPITLHAGDKKNISLMLPATGTISFTVRSLDGQGETEACKLTFIGQNREGVPDPFVGEGFLAADEAKIIHTVDGKGEAQLPAGTYRVIAGRGPEYSVDEKIVTVTPLQTTNIEFAIDRIVDTAGWIACDLHLHSEASPDSGVAVNKRVLAAMVEGLDLVAATDHDFIQNYRPSLEELGGLDKLVVLPGNELSHFSYAHFNGYPLRVDREATSNGATQWRNPSPSTTLPDGSPMPLYTPQDCFDSLRAMGDRELIDQDPVIVINHTEESFTGYLRAFGWEQYYGEFSNPDFLTIGDPVVQNGKLFSREASANFSWDFDAIEVINSKRFHDFRTATVEDVNESIFGQPPAPESPLLPILIRTGDEQVRILEGDLLLDHTNRGGIDDYFTMLVQGRRIAPLGNSDTHSTTKNEVGKCRTYIMSQYDDPRFIDVNEFVTNIKAARTIASTGPFIEMWVNGAPIGSDVYDNDGAIDVRIRAQAPPRMALDRLEIYGNGVLIGEVGRDSTDHYLGCDTAGLDIGGNESVVRFDETVTCHVEQDTVINVVAIGYEGMTPHINPVDGPAYDITDSLLAGVNQLLQEWLGVSNLIPMEGPLERNHEIYPYALTSAVWVDTDGYDADFDGYDYDGPGYIPGWFYEKDLEESLITASSLTQRQQAAILAAKSRVNSVTTRLLTPQNEPGEAQRDSAQDEFDQMIEQGCGGF